MSARVAARPDGGRAFSLAAAPAPAIVHRLDCDIRKSANTVMVRQPPRKMSSVMEF